MSKRRRFEPTTNYQATNYQPTNYQPTNYQLPTMNTDNIIFIAWLATWLPFLVSFYFDDVKGR